MHKYSICTLVTNFKQYEEMKQSYLDAGFNNGCQYLYIDNSNKNYYDGYSGINYFIKKSNSSYTIICHQDILINHDKREKLDLLIDELNTKDKYWAIAGNAGGGGDMSRLYCNINDSYTKHREENLPQKVLGLDENFLLINNEYHISCSIDLYGFHFYGTDLCLQALFNGCNSYVIDFYLTHLGTGVVDKSFYECRENLINKYSDVMQDKYIRTTCSKLFISSNRLKMQLFNSSLFLKFKTLFDMLYNKKYDRRKNNV